MRNAVGPFVGLPSHHLTCVDQTTLQINDSDQAKSDFFFVQHMFK